MLSVVPYPLREIPDRWRRTVRERRALTAHDPAADALELAARELDAAIAAAADAARMVTTLEYAESHGCRPATVRKWCARGELAGAQKPTGGDWLIPAGATRKRKRA